MPPATTPSPQIAAGTQDEPVEGAQSIATLRDQEEVDGVFACAQKERQISRAGTPYLTLALSDATGTIRARAFRDADLLAGRFERGELRGPRASRPIRRASCRPPIAIATSSKVSSNTSRARFMTRS
jgi:hypothetical protein